MKTTLYEISDLYRNLLTAIEDGTIEDPQAIDDSLEGIQQEFDDKCESIACIYKSLSAEADMLEAEANKRKIPILEDCAQGFGADCGNGHRDD